MFFRAQARNINIVFMRVLPAEAAGFLQSLAVLIATILDTVDGHVGEEMIINDAR
jgi:hypothetical protein